jgi:hypothetical protein
MNVDYEIHPEKCLIFMRFTGAFTLADLKEAVQRLWTDTRYSRSYNGVVDLTDSNVKVARGDFQALVAFVVGQKETSEGRWAAVATSPLATACGLIYKRAISKRHTFEVFSTFEAAEAFMGVDLKEKPFFGRSGGTGETKNYGGIF